MPVNKLIYPDDYPIEIVGPSELELRLAELEERLRLAGLQIGQGRRESGQEAIDVRSQSGSTKYLHNVLSRFSSDGLVRGTKALISGGQTDDEIGSTIIKLGYDTESLTPIGAVLGVPRHSMGAADTSSSGFVAGGTTAAGTSAAIDKLDFSVEATFSLSATLSDARSELVGIGTPSESYYFGGVDTSSAFLNKIEALNHPQNNIRAVGATLGSPRSNLVGLGNTASGYICSGKTGLGETYSSSIDKFSFGSETRTLVAAGLGVATAFAASVSNWLNGYICGGKNAGANASTIYRFVYGTEAIVPIAISLTTARADLIGCGSSVKGYLMGGGIDRSGEFKAAAPATTIERLTMISDRVSTESIQLLSISLGSSYLGGSASSDYASTVAEQGVATIANLYDDIYYRKELTLPRTELRRKLTGDSIFYVDINYAGTRTGNYGDITSPATNINDAIYYLTVAEPIDCGGYKIKIKVLPGTYVETIVLVGSNWVGLSKTNIGADLVLEGEATNPGAVKIVAASTRNILVTGKMSVFVEGFEFSTTLSRGTTVDPIEGLTVLDGGNISYRNLVFRSSYDSHLAIGDNSTMAQSGKVTIFGNLPSEPSVSCGYHVYISDGARWYSNANPVPQYAVIEFINTPAIDFLMNVDGGEADLSSVPTFLGATIGQSAIIAREGRVRLPWGFLLRGATLPLPTSIKEVANQNSRRDKLIADTVINIDNGYTAARSGAYGTPSNPCPSILAGVDYAKNLDLNNYKLTLQVSPGVYSENILINAAEWVGTNRSIFGADIYLRGNPANPASTILMCGSPEGIRIFKQIVVLIEGFKFVSSSGGNSAIRVFDGGTLLYSEVTFGVGFDTHITAVANSVLALAGSTRIEGGCTQHVSLFRDSVWLAGYSDVAYPGQSGSNSPRFDFIGSPAIDRLFSASTSQVDLYTQPVCTGNTNGKPLVLRDGSICVLPWGQLLPGGNIPFLPTTDPNIDFRTGVRVKVLSRPYVWVNNAYTAARAGERGTASNPFENINAAIKYLYGLDFGDTGATIRLADGVYVETVFFDAERISSSSIELEGNIAAPGNVTLRTSNLTYKWAIFIDRIKLTLRGIRFDSVRSGSNSAIDANYSQLRYEKCIFSFGLTEHIQGNNYSSIIPIGNYTVQAAGTCHIRLTSMSVFTAPGAILIDNQSSSLGIAYTFFLSEQSIAYLPDYIGWSNLGTGKRARIGSDSKIIQNSTNPSHGGTGLFQVPGSGIDFYTGGQVIMDWDI